MAKTVRSASLRISILDQEPGKRFRSAQELSDELGRFLRDEPIHARPIRAVEKAWRWCRRRPAVATLNFAVVLLVIAGTVGSNIAVWRVNIARRASNSYRFMGSHGAGLGHTYGAPVDRFSAAHRGHQNRVVQSGQPPDRHGRPGQNRAPLGRKHRSFVVSTIALHRAGRCHRLQTGRPPARDGFL